MTHTPSVDAMRKYLQCQYRAAEEDLLKKNQPEPKPFVTLSREAGAGAVTVSGLLVRILNADKSAERCPWAVFDREIAEQVIQERHLPGATLKFMGENAGSEIRDLIEEIFKLHPPTVSLVRQISETIAQIARLGHAVIIGRGGSVLTRRRPEGVHVRLIAPREKRIAFVAKVKSLSLAEAASWVDREDSGRREYLKKYFNRNVEETLLYDLVINTERVSHEAAAEMIAGLVLRKKKEILESR